MTSLPIALGARAEEDLIDVWRYIALRNLRAADRLLDRLERSWQLLATQPYSGRAREDIAPGLPQIVTGEYLSLYRVADEGIEIVRVLHGRRRIGPADVTA